MVTGRIHAAGWTVVVQLDHMEPPGRKPLGLGKRKMVETTGQFSGSGSFADTYQILISGLEEVQHVRWKPQPGREEDRLHGLGELGASLIQADECLTGFIMIYLVEFCTIELNGVKNDECVNI